MMDSFHITGEVVGLVAKMIYLGIEISGRLSPIEDCSTDETVHHAAEAIAAHSSTNSNMLLHVMCYGQLLEWSYFLDMCALLYVFPLRTCLIHRGLLYFQIRSPFLFSFACS